MDSKEREMDEIPEKEFKRMSLRLTKNIQQVYSVKLGNVYNMGEKFNRDGNISKESNRSRRKEVVIKASRNTGKCLLRDWIKQVEMHTQDI